MSNMNFDEYQDAAGATAIYPDRGRNFTYPALGLAGESGEVCEKLKKVIRDHGGQLDDEIRSEVAKELGDVLWYVSQVALEMGLSLQEIAKANIQKLTSRKQRDQIHGNGDNR
jgi:NTP pyrophosphatase (non-canonical NTP hydrolase)